MKRKVFIFLLMIIPLLLPDKQVWAEKVVANTANTQTSQIEVKKIDRQAKILAQYLAKFDSPLQNHAQDFIDAANTYQLDWKLLPAIAGVESTFGKQIPGGFNAWGWGVYGTQAVYFSSWRDGIFTIAKGLRENYFNKGLTDPFSINRAYAASPFWGGKVAYFMQDLENFANQPLVKYADTIQIGLAPAIAAVSGQPRLFIGSI